MSGLLGLLLGVSVLGLACVGAIVFQLRASDPAGNALAQVYLVAACAGLWLLLGGELLLVALLPPRPELPARNLAAAALFAVAVASQLAGVVVLSRDAVGPGARLAVQLAQLAAPLAVIVHVAWRAFPLSLSAALATQGCAALLLVACAVPWPLLAARRVMEAPGEPTLATLRFPALLLHADAPIEVIEGPADLEAMPSDRVAAGARRAPTLIDSTPAIYELRDLHRPDAASPLRYRLFLDAPNPAFEDVRGLVLRCSSLSAKPERDRVLRTELARCASLAELLRAVRDAR